MTQVPNPFITPSPPMTTLLPDPDTKAEDEKMKEPSRRWRNKWLVIEAGLFRDRVSGRFKVCKAGEVVWGDTSWPSKDIAESRAHGNLARNAARGRIGDKKYLGAFEVKE